MKTRMRTTMTAMMAMMSGVPSPVACKARNRRLPNCDTPHPVKSRKVAVDQEDRRQQESPTGV